MHRRLTADDGRGVGEPLLEFGQFHKGLIVRGKHLLLVDTIEDSARLHRKLGEELLLPPSILIHNNNKPASDFVNNYNGMVCVYIIREVSLLARPIFLSSYKAVYCIVD